MLVENGAVDLLVKVVEFSILLFILLLVLRGICSRAKVFAAFAESKSYEDITWGNCLLSFMLCLAIKRTQYICKKGDFISFAKFRTGNNP